jgi:branched-chain amino acid transport system permease protein
MTEQATTTTAPAAAARPEVTPGQIARYAGRVILVVAAVFCVVWVLFLADNSALERPQLFITTTLNAITLSGLYFVVASGFTLIFGLMRVVNMAHGSFFLLAGYVAAAWDKDHDQWLVGLVLACVFVAILGVIMQQTLLRWNQGQDLRQALITIAVSVILADQMLAKYGGVPTDMTWPDWFDRKVPIGLYGIEYSFTRLLILFAGILTGLFLWLWLKKTRTGMVIRAGVDDRSMVSALGINIQRVFMIAFAVGTALAGLGGVLYANYGGIQAGKDADFLLISLIVVIIGGMGSLGGAAIGAVLFGLVDTFSDIYLPQEYTNYGVLLTFALLVAVLAVRPLGLFGRPA